MQILSIGEVLWDVFEQGELLGGAPLNFSANAARLGNHATLLTAVGTDERGVKALEAMNSLELTTKFVQLSVAHQTGAAIVVTDSEGNARYSIARPAAFDDLQIDGSLLDQLEALAPDWIYFGTLCQSQRHSEQSVLSVIRRISRAKCFYDINLRDGHWSLPLVESLSALASVVKLNDDEAQLLFSLTLASGDFSIERFCRHWCSQHGVDTIIVTLGRDGCAVFSDGNLLRCDGFDVNVVDTVGAGDAFSAAFLHGFHLGWPMDRTAKFANAVGAIVASRAGATPFWTPDECLQLIMSS